LDLFRKSFIQQYFPSFQFPQNAGAERKTVLQTVPTANWANVLPLLLEIAGQSDPEQD